MSNDSQFDREKQLFEQAIEHAAGDDRLRFLNEACGADTALMTRLQNLLRAHEQAEGFLPEQNAGANTVLLPDLKNLEGPGTVIGRYKLLEKIGEGGFGVVYMAEQREPVKRRVALKIIKVGMDTRQVVARFEAERQALALMDHPCIAKVFDAGATETGRPYFVMELVRGIRITDYCDQNNLPMPQRLELFIQVCQAVQHAHQKGIIHRDIKPSNILVTLHDGVPVPKVIDFGIAKATQQELTEKTVFTRFQEFIGTPAYMSPEQAEMSGLDIDTRSDIYSLGVLLYELMTGWTPFDPGQLIRAGIDGIRRTLREVEPPRPSTRLGTMSKADAQTVGRARQAQIPALVKLIRRDLDWIVMKCLEKDRTRRYETANGLATDLKRHLNNEPVAARPPSRIYRLQKLIRRNKYAVGAAVAIAITLVAGIILSTFQAARARRAERVQSRLRVEADGERQAAVAARQQADEARNSEAGMRLLAESRAYASDMNQAREALDESNFLRAQQLLQRHNPNPGQRDLRNWEWRYLQHALLSEESVTLGRQSGRPRDVAFSPDGTIVASCGLNGEVRFWNISAPTNSWYLSHTTSLYALAFQPKGNLIAAAGRGAVMLWNWETRTLSGKLAHDGWLRKVCFFPDGKRLATFCEDSKVHIWDVATQTELKSFPIPTTSYVYLLGGLAVSYDSQFIAVASGDNRIFLISTDRDESPRIIEQGSEISALAFSPNTNLLASAGWDGRITLHDVDASTSSANLRSHQAFVSSLAFSPSGDLLISGGGDQVLRLWSTREWQSPSVLKGHRDEVCAVAFSPNSEHIASLAKDGEVKLWKAADYLHTTEIVRGPTNVQAFGLVPTDRFTAYWHPKKTIKIYSAKDMALVAEFSAGITNVASLTVSPDGKHCACVDGANGTAMVFRTVDGFEEAQLTSEGSTISSVRFTPGGSSLLAVEGTNSCCLWSATNWTRLVSAPIPIPKTAAGLRLSFDGQWLAVLDRNRPRLWRISSQPISFPIAEPRGTCMDAGFSPDGKLLATALDDGYVYIQKPGKTDPIVRFRAGLLSTVTLTFSPDGSRLVTGNDDGFIRFWETQSLEPVLRIRADGAWLAAGLRFADANTLLALANARLRDGDGDSRRPELLTLGTEIGQGGYAYVRFRAPPSSP